MRQSLFFLILPLVLLITIAPLNAEAQAEPFLQIGSGTVGNGSVVEIPIYFNNDRGLTAIQFDLTFDPSFFNEVDTSQCLYQLPEDNYLATCRRQDWPNQDVVRFIAVSLNGQSIPTGELGFLLFRASADTFSGISPLNILECTSLGVVNDQPGRRERSAWAS